MSSDDFAERQLDVVSEQSFFDKSSSVRWFMAAIFIFALMVFLHFREESLEVLDLDNVAQSYIVAQIDFDFLDREATAILREEALRDIGKIYELVEKEVRARRLEFDNSSLYDQAWRSQLSGTTYEEMYQTGDLVEKALIQLRFTDPRTLRKMSQSSLSASHYIVFTPVDPSKPFQLPSHIWELIRQEIEGDESQVSAETVQFVLNYFKYKEWHIQEDLSSLSLLRYDVQRRVKDKYTHVKAGSTLINQGEKVSTRHLAMLQAMKRALSESHHLWSPMTLLGSLMLAVLLTGVSAVYFYYHYPQILVSNRKLCLLIVVVLITLGLAKATEFFLLNSRLNLIELIHYPVLVPFAAIVLCSLINVSVATYVSGFLTVVFNLALAFNNPFFLLINLAAALVAILSARSLRRRKEIFIVCGQAWLSCVVALLAMHLYQNNLGITLMGDILSTAFCLLLTGVLVVGVLPLLESSFQVMTDVSLMEYMDPNSDLLRHLSIEAPGTYQHSVLVGNLSEAAALAIGANGLFCRVATLYHDIGKMATPQYFSENQQPGINLHQLLTPTESAQVIIAHVSEGVAMGRKAGLPEQLIAVIKEHHGTQLVYYFYSKELERCGGDPKLVNEKEFRYSGPKPHTKESTIIMLADCLEAASRSLDLVNEESLTCLANQLIREKADDGQLDNCMLTFEELAKVKESLVKNLVVSSHARIKYPKRIIKGAKDA